MSPSDSPSDKGPRSSPTSNRRAAPLTPVPERGPTSSRRDRDPSGEAGAAPSLEGFPLAVFRELTQYLSEPNARALLMATASAAGMAVSTLAPNDLALIITQIEKTFDVFGLGAEAKAKCRFNLRTLSRSSFPQSEIVVAIDHENDIVTAREAGKQMCAALGFSEVAYVKVATAISELARNIVKYAGNGSVTLRVLRGHRRGVEAVVTDEGPGIADVEAVLSPRYRSRSGMGVGLRGTRRLMDHFEVKSQVGRGTTITIRKYQD